MYRYCNQSPIIVIYPNDDNLRTKRTADSPPPPSISPRFWTNWAGFKKLFGCPPPPILLSLITFSLLLATDLVLPLRKKTKMKKKISYAILFPHTRETKRYLSLRKLFFFFFQLVFKNFSMKFYS